MAAGKKHRWHPSKSKSIRTSTTASSNAPRWSAIRRSNELITHVLEKEVDRLSGDKADLETTKERLKGLGYLA